jgi:competence protein ComEA
VPLLTACAGLAAGAALVGAVLFSLGAVSSSSQPPLFAESLSDAPLLDVAVDSSVPAAEIVVDVAGAVVRPGLHRLRSGDRVGDAIEAAGGFAPRADLAASSQTLNLARPLDDGAKVLVPELGIDRPTQAAAVVDDGRIDLNRASQSELESLPGIGPVTAGKIIDARQDRRFGGIRDLRDRGLVGESVYEDIKDSINAG